MRIERKWLWWALGGAGALLVTALAFTQRRRIVSFGKFAFDAAKVQAFKALILPTGCGQFADAILQVASETDTHPVLLVAFMTRESACGSALKPKGSGGTGDFTKRTTKNASYSVVPGATVVANSDGSRTITPTSRGWGHGLMQIDYGSFADWIDKNNWQDPVTNMRKGLEVLKGKRAYIASKLPNLSPDDLFRASVAAYNTGEGNVVKSLLAGKDPDATTAHGNYSSAVLSTAASLAAKLG